MADGGEHNGGAAPHDPRGLPPLPETRALRYEIMESATARTFDEDLAKIAAHGFNTVIVSAFRRGQALFRCAAMEASRMATRLRAFRDRDPLAELIHAADALGLSVLGHAEILNVGSAEDGRPSPILKRRPDWRLRRGSKRQAVEGLDKHRYFLNPAEEEARRLIGDVLYELAERYAVAGVYINDLRYPRGLTSPAQSLLARDVDAFVRSKGGAIGHDAVLFASGGASGGASAGAPSDASAQPLFQELQTWRNEQLNELLRYLHCRLERANARVWIVSQAVGPYDGQQLRTQLQGDWGLWLSQQYLDGAAPRYRFDTDREFEAALRADLQWLPEDRALYPLLDAAELQAGARIGICRRLPLAGVIIRFFHTLQDMDWELLGELFRRPARPTEERPYLAALSALAECRRLLSGRPELADFFADLLRILPAQPGPRGQALEPGLLGSAMGNLRSLESKMGDGSIPLEESEQPVHRWVGVARRCLALSLRH